MLYIIEKPLITERTSRLAEKNVYAFKVNRKANKTDIKKAIEKSFQVKVASVRTMVCRGRARRNRHGYGKVPYWKKALVRLKEGQSISLFEGV